MIDEHKQQEVVLLLGDVDSVSYVSQLSGISRSAVRRIASDKRWKFVKHKNLCLREDHYQRYREIFRRVANDIRRGFRAPMTAHRRLVGKAETHSPVR